MSANETVACDLCASPDHKLLFVKEGFRHVRCNNCGLVFVNPRLHDHLDRQSRTGTGSMGEDLLTPAQVRRLQRELTRLEPFRRLNRILEVGAGRGWFLGEASRLGWHTWAVEINSDALQRLRSKGIEKITTQPAEDLQAPEDSMDVVRMWDVIEHLSSPRKAVTAIHNALRPGGLLTLSTTNFASLSRRVNGPEWVYLNGADHIFLFEPATITRLLTEIGFRDIGIRTRSFNLRRKLYHPEEDLPPRWLILRPFRKIIDETLRFTLLGHQMLVTAVKR
ncbi:MAG: class I SAM-dependent methyltransferase [Desulfomonile tiedjei]|uniref:Class I SAM-dependent methyltransferase n=1 Tax=Desulfomonile tiedjei TaxID=2358 RepID=A0A9D6Z521_9BACT|nr:class I SAM-dependent methyltransferase [Desulfomonile tiedjei]